MIDRLMTTYARYPRTPKTRWVFGRDALMQIQLLRDATGQPIYRITRADEVHDTVFGLPFRIDDTSLDTVALEEAD